MKITKYAHACLLIEIDGARIILDPGSWNDTPNATEIDAVLITHEHQDHFVPAQVKAIRARSPEVAVITHAAVGKLLEAEGIAHTVIQEGESIRVNGVSVESFGHDHAIIYGTTPPCRNTGYFIGGRVFVPGDALHDVPNRTVEVLALPTGGPWMKMAEAIEYAKRVKPRVVFPIHDAMYTEGFAREFVPRIVGGHLSEAGIEFRDMAPGTTKEF